MQKQVWNEAAAFRRQELVFQETWKEVESILVKPFVANDECGCWADSPIADKKDVFWPQLLG